MTWDEDKSARDPILSADWDSMVADQKSHVGRHQDGGDDEANFLPRNRLYSVTPTASSWSAAPTSLGNMTDNDWSTSAGTGSFSATHAAGCLSTVGKLVFDMGSTYGVFVTGKFGMWNDNDKPVGMHIGWSDDNSTWQENDLCHNQEQTEEVFQLPTQYLRARYIQLKWKYIASGTTYVKPYEVQAVELPNMKQG